MIRYILCLPFVLVSLFVNAQHTVPAKPGENFITLTGDRFKNEKIILTPHATGYNNLWFDNGKDKFTDIDLIGKYDGRSVDFQLRFPGKDSTYIIENNRTSTGSQQNDNNCLFLMNDKDTYGDGMGADPGSLKVIVTRYDKVGGLIEGSIDGILNTGARNNSVLKISGKFSVIRDKDKKAF